VSSAGYDSSGQRVAFDRQGDALLVWVRESQVYPYPRRVQVRSRSRTGAWGPILALSPSGQAPRSPKVVLDDDGDGVVVWQGKGADNIVSSVRAGRVTASGTFGNAQVVASNGRSPATAVTPSGRALVAWERRFQVDLRIQASVGP
jgi:hypothetical protein